MSKEYNIFKQHLGHDITCIENVFEDIMVICKTCNTTITTLHAFENMSSIYVDDNYKEDKKKDVIRRALYEDPDWM